LHVSNINPFQTATGKKPIECPQFKLAIHLKKKEWEYEPCCNDQVANRKSSVSS